MKNNNLKLIVIISLIVLVSFLGLGIIDYSNYNRIIAEDNLKIISLISANTYSEINIELLKPIFVSMTMANDQFLKDWAVEEEEENPESIKKYLSGIKTKYNYDSVFFISDTTKNYYTHDRTLKQISKTDTHDVWYYEFIKKDVEYDLIIDTDQATGNTLTFFVNCLVKDSDGKILGVTGVGVQTERIRQILLNYVEKLRVSIFLVDSEGKVQIQVKDGLTENYNLFNGKEITDLQNKILSKKDELQTLELGNNFTRQYLTSHYLKELGWYLIIKKDTSAIISEMLKSQVIYKSIFFLIILLSVIIINSRVIIYFQNKILKMASTDGLTELNNRRVFDRHLLKTIMFSEKKNMPFTLVFFDVDDFKLINDKYGHVAGDELIKDISGHIKGFVRSNDIIARWGGDEFAIIFNCAIDDAIKIIQRAKQIDKDNILMLKYNTTLSIGMAEYKLGDTPKSILHRADEAMRHAKKNGKNQVCIK